MLKKLYVKDKKIVILIVIIIACLISIPFFLYRSPYELIVTSPTNNKIGKSGEVIEFKLIFEQKGGISDRQYEISNIETVGDWEINIDGTSIRVPPNSVKEIYFIINIPDNGENGEKLYIRFDLTDRMSEQQGDHYLSGVIFTVRIDNRDPPEIEIDEGYLRESYSSYNLRLSPFVFIPVAMIVICVIILFILIKVQTDKKQSEFPNFKQKE